jgi:PiT family inorganic phosphate transporter
MNPLILLGCAAVAVGAFTIARRTLDTLGNDITDLPLPAAIVVAVVASVIVTALSAIGIPASFVIVATMSIVGLGWGRATRSVTVAEGVTGERQPQVSVGAIAASADDPAPDIGEPEDVPAASDLFDPETTARVVLMQNVVPVLSTAGAYAAFRALFAFALV